MNNFSKSLHYYNKQESLMQSKRSFVRSPQTLAFVTTPSYMFFIILGLISASISTIIPLLVPYYKFFSKLIYTIYKSLLLSRYHYVN